MFSGLGFLGLVTSGRDMHKLLPVVERSGDWEVFFFFFWGGGGVEATGGGTPDARRMICHGFLLLCELKF